jgi:superfamily II DNA/RNA helicase
VEREINCILREGWASAYIAGGQIQQDRNTTMKSLRDFQLRILVSTDLVCSLLLFYLLSCIFNLVYFNLVYFIFFLLLLSI